MGILRAVYVFVQSHLGVDALRLANARTPDDLLRGPDEVESVAIQDLADRSW